ncbi:tRNA (adenosine(37)-N6)-threonylcarbamoyltransferase complex dimerization subunit type 1 TsaB [Desulfobacter hydrogenophilus]|uniref:tRNA (Adenosine(37)-N6)-threonylcarbamoyltransferase complex dimerization subunit type 1 TsaB n=1 Tax=Desulfobacter hydrogenophilus TaxID=2291 RepID=A0A328FCC1_9BACT|nr:tRNA (adenosine(37)-N6)-threonylcarbamoyltransferase complex dimerization subunit type 1 TsaB [Desulfobacter hydrogenophilus]NDY72017.1 tRNA (adenosine(37)-N6)-threonylcarbamoyltransferase complex dimerization subunit type 1 TsaB [Desulfobacter hydrogenophilus]QBH15464.1 tRNA (adenosine(37)-N6)-threonylcarbamoyltransferase complex dimerization subunit type 1 TsaB [Desulfobacter hydrogenophilus]RAM01939.1 tRNA (adenosine(37)-N6)-threonylcarbamoyltransferase complex dimerization subunit type 1 
MYLFALSTAEQGASMALFEENTLVFESRLFSRQTHSKGLLPMIEQAVESREGMTVDRIDGFIAARGPGSFTGLRIGISMVKGLARAVSKPCAGVSSLDGIAFRFCYSQKPVCVMMDAKRKEVYSAIYQFHRGRLLQKGPEMVCSPETAIDQAGSEALFVGSGSKVYRETIYSRTHDKGVLSTPSMDGVSACALVLSALSDEGVFDFKNHPLNPVYLRKSDAQIHFEEKTGA